MNREGHWYAIPGHSEKVPSVTTVLSVLDKQYLAKWKVNIALDYAEDKIKEGVEPAIAFKDAREAAEEAGQEAAQVGTQTHALISSYFKTPYEEPLSLLKEEKDFRVHSAFRAFLKWRVDTLFKPLVSEQFVYSEHYAIAGTLDTVGTFAGGRSLVLGDFKAANSLWASYHLQCAAYAKLWEETEGSKITQAFLIRLDKETASYEQREVKDLDFLWEVFLNVLKVFKSLPIIEAGMKSKKVERI